MFDRKAIKERGKAAFKKNYWMSVAVAFVMGLFVSGTAGVTFNSRTTFNGTTTEVTVDSNMTLTDEQTAALAAIVIGGLATIGIIAFVAHTLIANPIEVGGRRFFRKNATDQATPFAVMAEGFQNYGHVVVTMLLRDVFVMLWSLLFVIPGVMKAYSYRMVPYIVKDNPEIAPMDALALSTKMMKGSRWQTFVMDLSFLGWMILGTITFNLGNIFWTSPYMNAADAELYLELKNRA
ncbi:MAG: DUF975 family protein [Atopobiaceae bacterium]|nr:DUF975 family protein [Atopobiaceae bacterium]